MSKSYDESPEGVAELLEDAADLLEHNEWIQGALKRTILEADDLSQPVKVGYCAVGSLIWTADETWDWQDGHHIREHMTPALEQALRFVRNALPGSDDDDLDDIGVIEVWNDANEYDLGGPLGRTKQEVLDVFRKTAKEVRS